VRIVKHKGTAIMLNNAGTPAFSMQVLDDASRAFVKLHAAVVGTEEAVRQWLNAQEGGTHE
jgi:hypothetical protein